MSLQHQIEQVLRDVAEQTGSELVDTLSDDTVLLESGLDSLGFAIVVAQLEEDLGYDPFALMDDPIYPATFGEFVFIYERYANS